MTTWSAAVAALQAHVDAFPDAPVHWTGARDGRPDDGTGAPATYVAARILPDGGQNCFGRRAGSLRVHRGRLELACVIPWGTGDGPAHVLADALIGHLAGFAAADVTLVKADRRPGHGGPAPTLWSPVLVVAAFIVFER